MPRRARTADDKARRFANIPILLQRKILSTGKTTNAKNREKNAAALWSLYQGRRGAGRGRAGIFGGIPPYPWTGEEGEISYTYNVGLNGGYYFLDNLRLESALDFIYVMNFENKADNNQFDVQWTLSLKYSIF